MNHERAVPTYVVERIRSAASNTLDVATTSERCEMLATDLDSHHAIRAWCAAAECVAWPLFPAILRSLVAEYRGSRWQTAAGLAEFVAEASRRSDWPPSEDGHFVAPRAADFWAVDDAAFGLTWRTSVHTILACVDGRWCVYVNGHRHRMEYALRTILCADRTADTTAERVAEIVSSLGGESSESRMESLRLASEAGASDEVLAQLARAVRVSRGSTIVLPARSGRGPAASWGWTVAHVAVGGETWTIAN